MLFSETTRQSLSDLPECETTWQSRKTCQSCFGDRAYHTCQNMKQPGRVVRPARVVSEIITDYYKNGWNYGVIRPARVVSETEFRVV